MSEENTPPSQNNVYGTPVADVMPETPNSELTEPQKRPLGDGWTWIADAFSIFKDNLLMWIVFALLFGVVSFAVALVTGFIPFIGAVAQMCIGSMLLGGVYWVIQEAVDTGEVDVGGLFEGFRRNTGQLAIVGLLYFAGAMVVVVIALIFIAMGIGFEGLSNIMNAPDIEGENVFAGVMLGVLVAFSLLIPVMMAYWFAPILVIKHDKPAIEAMKLSFSGCLRNMLPLFVYSIILGILFTVAAIPLFLGLFVMFPVGMITYYTMYRSIFTQ